MYPTLKVKLNKELDKKVCLQFINFQKAGIDFGRGIITIHSGLREVKKFSGKSQSDFVSKYVDSFYEKNNQELENTRIFADEQWKAGVHNFFGVADKYFKKHPWPEGKYIGYLSIFNCNPRFLEDKTFQIFWKHPKSFISIAAHEMLHFLFYDYFLTKFSKEKFTNESLWKLSEVANYLLLKEKEFIEITSDSQPDLYPDLLYLVYKLAPVWKRDKNIEKLTNYYLKIA